MGRYAKKRLAYVTPFLGSQLKYGFKTNVDSTVGSEAGHRVVETVVPTGLVIGANAPKPARGTRVKVIAGVVNTDSTFVDANKRNTLPSGWSVQRPKVRRGRPTQKTVIAYVTIRGVNYAWNLPKTTQVYMKNDLGSLGIKIATGNDKDLAFGSDYPKPPKVGKIYSGGSGGIDNISTFCDPSALDRLPTGWAPLRDDGSEL